MRVVILLAAAPSLLATSASWSQQPEAVAVIPDQGAGTITFYDRTSYNGAALTFRRTEGRTQLPFAFRSVRVEGAWRVCDRANFAGRCVRIDRNYSNSQRQIGVFGRLISIQSLASGGAGNWSGPIRGPSLHGWNSQFYAAPEIGRRRVESCRGANIPGCATRTAQQLCRHAGYGRAISFNQQPIGRTNYIADLLCGR